MGRYKKLLPDPKILASKILKKRTEVQKGSEMDLVYTIINAIETMKKIQPDMSLQGMLTFYTVKALEFEEGCATVKQISERLSIPSSSAGKLVKSHTLMTRYGVKGSQLLKTMENPSNRQSTLVQMTLQGNKALPGVKVKS
jgi:hypothetical protein